MEARNLAKEVLKVDAHANLTAVPAADFCVWRDFSATASRAWQAPAWRPVRPCRRNCAASLPGATERPAAKAQLVYQDWRTDWFPPMAQAMLEQFHETHPNIRVFFTLDPENLEEKMMTDFQAGTAPDVFAGCCDFFPIWAQKGYTLDLRPYVAADLDRATVDDWDPVQYQALFTRDGKQYGLPKYHGALALYFNKDLFDAFKLPVSGRELEPRRLPAGHAAPHPRRGRQRPDRCVGQHVRYLVGANSGPRQRVGRPLRRPGGPGAIHDGRAAGAGGHGMAARPHVGRPGHAFAAGRAEEGHAPGVRRRHAGDGRGRLLGAARHPGRAPTFASASPRSRPARPVAPRWPPPTDSASMPARSTPMRPGSCSSS